MAFIFVEPWCYADITDTARGAWVPSSGVTYSTSGGRYGLGAATCVGGAGIRTLSKGFEAAGTLILNFAIKFTGLGNGEHEFFRAGNGNGTEQCFGMKVGILGALTIYNQAGTKIHDTGNGRLILNTWHVFRVQLQVGSATGTCKVWLDDMSTAVLDTTTDLLSTDTTNADWIMFLGSTSGNGMTPVISEMFAYDTSGAGDWAAPIRDKRLYVLEPSAETTQIAWTPSTGTDNAALVDDPQSGGDDGDSTYVSSDLADASDLYEFDDLPAGVVNIVGIVGQLTTRKTDGGSLTATSFLVRIEAGPAPGGTQEDGTLNMKSLLTSTYVNYQTLFPEQPGGSTAWTRATVNDMIMGPLLKA